MPQTEAVDRADERQGNRNWNEAQPNSEDSYQLKSENQIIVL